MLYLLSYTHHDHHDEVWQRRPSYLGQPSACDRDPRSAMMVGDQTGLDTAAVLCPTVFRAAAARHSCEVIPGGAAKTLSR